MEVLNNKSSHRTLAAYESADSRHGQAQAVWPFQDPSHFVFPLCKWGHPLSGHSMHAATITMLQMMLLSLDHLSISGTTRHISVGTQLGFSGMNASGLIFNSKCETFQWPGRVLYLLLLCFQEA